MLKAVGKQTRDTNVVDVVNVLYPDLCEMVHPSAAGHQIFWAPPPPGWQSYTDRLPMSVDRKQPNNLFVESLSNCVWAVTWGTQYSLECQAFIAKEQRWCAHHGEYHPISHGYLS